MALFRPSTLLCASKAASSERKIAQKTARRKVLRIFSEADFFQDNEAAADNTGVLSRQMRQYWEKSALKKRFGFNSQNPMHKQEMKKVFIKRYYLFVLLARYVALCVLCSCVIGSLILLLDMLLRVFYARVLLAC